MTTKTANVDASTKLVSIIVPAYNCEFYIERTVKSVQVQDYQNWEMIIVDDCSTDKTGEIIKTLMQNDGRIQYIKLKKNSGAAVSRNIAIQEARGNYIAFLDSDDLWKREKLSKQIEFMTKNKYSFSCTSYDKIDEDDQALGEVRGARKTYTYDDILKHSPGNSTVIYCADVLGKFIIPDIRKRNDYVLWLQIIKKSGYLYGIPEVLASHRIRKGSISKNKFLLVKYHWIVYRKIEKLALFKSCFLILYWVFVTLFKRYK